MRCLPAALPAGGTNRRSLSAAAGCEGHIHDHIMPGRPSSLAEKIAIFDPRESTAMLAAGASSAIRAGENLADYNLLVVGKGH